MEENRREADYESTPITRAEYITALVHLYRGELSRATAWRIRFDTTTNWAILTSAGLLSFSFSGAHHTHWVMLVGLMLIFTLMGYEARRFRFFDVWRYRVRLIEENFYGPLLRRDPSSPDEMWGMRVAHDLLEPHFKISFRAAVRARFTRNYWAIFAVLLGSWTMKVMEQPTPVTNWDDIKRNLETGVLPWWVAVGYVGGVLFVLLFIFFVCPRSQESEDAYWNNDSARKREVSSLDA